MATYQDFRTNLITKLNDCDDAALAQMVNDLMDYTDALIIEHVIPPNQPPMIPILGGGNKATAAADGIGDKNGQPPMIPTLGGGSKIT